MTNTAPTVLDTFQQTLQGYIADFESVKATFSKKLNASPLDALAQNTDAVVSATLRRDIASMLNDYIENSRQSREAGSHGQTDTQMLNSILKDLMSRVFTSARNPPRSSSPITNLIEQTRTKVLSELIEYIQFKLLPTIVQDSEEHIVYKRSM
jgi:hypothetical protein